MVKDIWINLPVKDVKKSKEFFVKLGFKLNPNNGNTENSACFLVGDRNIVLMLFDEPSFNGFTNHALADTKQGSEVLLSVGVGSKEQVDELAKKAVEAGGTSTHTPGKMEGWMYGCLFVDLDGHRWNALYMDMSKMPR